MSQESMVPKQSPPRSGALADTFHVVEDPPDLGPREVGVKDEARPLADHLRELGVLHPERLREVGRASALPHDRMADRLAGLAIPDDGGLPWLVMPIAGDLARTGIDARKGLSGDGELRLPDLVGVMLHPAGLRKELRELLVGQGAYGASLVEQDAPVAGGTSVKSP
jgi:hypothetical protein